MTFRVVLGSFLQILLETLLNGYEQNNCNNFLITFLHCKGFWEDSKLLCGRHSSVSWNQFFSVFCMSIIIKTLVFLILFDLMFVCASPLSIYYVVDLLICSHFHSKRFTPRDPINFRLRVVYDIWMFRSTCLACCDYGECEIKQRIEKLSFPMWDRQHCVWVTMRSYNREVQWQSSRHLASWFIIAAPWAFVSHFSTEYANYLYKWLRYHTLTPHFHSHLSCRINQYSTH